MAHGLNPINKNEIECNSNKSRPVQISGSGTIGCNNSNLNAVVKVDSINQTNSIVTPPTKMGSRRIFTPQFKLQVLDSYRNDNDCKGNQRATARKYGIHRRQIQKWLQCEGNLRSSVINSSNSRGENNGSSSGNVVKTSCGNQSDSGKINITKNYVNHSSSTTTVTSEYVPQGLTYTTNDPSITYQNSNEHHNSSVIISSPHYAAIIVPTSNVVTTTPADYRLHNYNYDSYYNNQHAYDYNTYYEVSLPIDLSLHRNSLNSEPEDLCKSNKNNPIKYGGEWTNNTKVLTDISKSTYPKVEAWDLSFRKRKSSHFSDDEDQTTPKPVKLFKPYLLDDDDTECSNEKKLDKSNEPRDPVIWSHHPSSSTSSISSPIYENNNFFPNEYNLYSNSLYPTSSSSFEIASYWYPPQHSPISGCDSTASVSSNFSVCSDISDHLYTFQNDHQTGNGKFHHHRKDIQKWLHEDHLRHRMILTN